MNRRAAIALVAATLAVAGCGGDAPTVGDDLGSDGGAGDAGPPIDLHATLDARSVDAARAGDLATADLAGVCGVPGAPCCAKQLCVVGCCRSDVKLCVPVGGACLGGGCCDSAGCVASGAAPANDPSRVCENGGFVSCGGDGQACCAANACSMMGCCAGARCAATGAMCHTAGICSAMGQSCGGCGAAGQGCCRGAPAHGGAADYCTAANLACDGNGKCAHCGAVGETCCDGNACDGGGCCNHASGLCVAPGGACGNLMTCKDGGCADGTCGALGQAASGGGVGCTAASTVEANGMCYLCGGLGETCCAGRGGGYCAPPFACNTNLRKCQQCGANGQACCQGSACPASTNMICGANDTCN